MASFFEDLWESIFTPGATPTLVVATNATFACLQFLLLLLLLATRSIHFIILSILCGGLWGSINWFVREMRDAKLKEEAQMKRDNSSEPERMPGGDRGDSDTETEVNEPRKFLDVPRKLPPRPISIDDETDLRQRKALADSSGYVSTDSEWEKLSEEGEKQQ